MSPRRLLVPLAAAMLAVAGLLHQPSLIGTACWAAAVIAACAGWGAIVAKLAGIRVSLWQTAATGLALVVAVGTVCARLGILGHTSQLGVIGVGILATALLDVRPPRRWWIVPLVVGVPLIVLEALRAYVPVLGGTNHVFAIKRLWDLGGFGLVHHQLGAQLVGESLFAIAPGAQAVSLFENGVCAALVLFLWVEQTRELETIPRRLGLILIALPIAMFPQTSDQWSGVLFNVCAYFGLRAALENGRISWQTLICGVALCTLRNEYVLLGAVYIGAAIALPRGMRFTGKRIAFLLALWAAGIMALQVALAVPPLRAAGNTVGLLAVIPLVAFLLRIVGEVSWRSAISVFWFATLTTTIAVGIHAIRKVQHIDAGGVTLWFSAALVTLFEVLREPPLESLEPRRQFHRGAASLAIVMVFAGTSFFPYFEADRFYMFMRYREVVFQTREYLELGPPLGPYQDVHDVQQLVPAGARIGFWGQSAAQLDFRRNPITDLSWPRLASLRRERNFLTSMTPESLKGIDYLVFEELDNNGPVDPWDTRYEPATRAIAGQLEDLGGSGLARAYRVRR